MCLHLALGSVVGLILVLTGAGGGILAVPLLVFCAGLSTVEAGAVGLLAVSLSAAFAAFAGWRAGLVQVRIAVMTALCGAVCAPLGARVADRIDERLLTAMFACILGHVSLRILWQRRPAAPETPSRPVPPCLIDPVSGRIAFTAPCCRALLGAGALSGVLSGLFGVGGGFVMVPALHRKTDLGTASVAATSLAAIAIISSATVASNIQGDRLDWNIALPFALGALAGAGAGRVLAARIGGSGQQQAFAWLAFGTALAMFAKAALPALFRSLAQA